MFTRRRRRTIGRAVAVGALAVSAVGCGGGTPEITSDGAQSPASDVAARSPSPTGAPTRTTSPPAPSSPDSSTSTPAASSMSVTPPTTSSPDPTPSDTAPPAEDDTLPARAPAEHGGTAVAVYLAVTDEGYDSPPVQRAQAAAADLGYDVGAADLGCDRGAAEALGYETGAGQTWAAVALYYATPEEAEEVRGAAEAMGHPVEGVAQVTTYCLD